MNNISKEVYLNAVLNQVPRLLGLLDRNISSKTYGCFDRCFWHYKAIDFPCARYQEAVLTLALLYKHGPTPYRNNINILKWINASINFWCNIQQGNGSFCEWYPMENSFVASAFSAYAISETLLVLGESVKPHTLRRLEKVGDWLCDKQDFRASNQTSGAICALYNIFLLTHIPKYKLAAEKKVRLMEAIQSKEGWFNEYGGADIGYLSLTIDYLAKYYQKTKDDIVLSMIKKATSFIAEFVYPGFIFGGNFGSRNTEYLVPSGFEIISVKFKEAAYCAMNIRKATLEGNAISLSSLDDRYLSYMGYNWLQAYVYAGDINSPMLEEKEIVYPEAGIYIRRAKDFFLVSNFKKGGAFNLFIPLDKKIFDSGVLAKDFGGNNLCSGYMGSSHLDVQQKDKIVIKGYLGFIRELRPTTFKFLLLRLFQILLGKFEKISFFIKQKLRDKLITKTLSSHIPFTRIIQFQSGKIKVIDKMHLNNNKLKKIILGAKGSYIYVPSSRYFHDAEIDNVPVLIEDSEITRCIEGDSFVFVRSFEISKNI